uniref:Uncharacterized protein n=1 Tax=Anguilla anguilla TaxID=7936 RepID=A0A0E9WGA9_ANGAN
MRRLRNAHDNLDKLQCRSFLAPSLKNIELSVKLHSCIQSTRTAENTAHA